MQVEIEAWNNAHGDKNDDVAGQGTTTVLAEVLEMYWHGILSALKPVFTTESCRMVRSHFLQML